MVETTAIIACYHGEKGNPQPCPPACPRQDWPRAYFHLTFFKGHWKLDRRWRHLEREWQDRVR